MREIKQIFSWLKIVILKILNWIIVRKNEI